VKLATESERYEGLLRGAAGVCDPQRSATIVFRQLHVEGTAQISGRPNLRTRDSWGILAAIEAKLGWYGAECLHRFAEPVLVQIGLQRFPRGRTALISAPYTLRRWRSGSSV